MSTAQTPGTAIGRGCDGWASAPIIAVTYSAKELPEIGRDLAWQLAFQSVAAAGGVPLAIDCSSSQPHLDGLLGDVDGLLMLGGGDIGPALYGGDPGDPTLDGVDQLRDEQELQALESAARLGLPTLAICRGLQLVNAWRGGTLWTDLERDAAPGVQHRPGLSELVRTCHRVTVADGSRISQWMSLSGPTEVNSQHHQGVREVGAGLRVTARADDGMVEGLESDDGLIVAVQWHPEYLWASDDNAARFLAGFVASCCGRRGTGSS